jgi:hypothetical protein
MPRATTRCQDAPLVQLIGDSPNAGEPLVFQVIHDGLDVLRAALSVRLDRSYSLLVADLLPLERSCACSS